ncbi:UDP-N-acetylmuramate dehydrogenase [Patescibacteria group bacterium]|nr:UDP-N-acetylmuramate dehydrogenase [Patescibacteria group bacterium]
MSIKIQKNIPLSKYTSFKIGGPAKFFCVAENVDEIQEALEFAEKNKLKVFVLGGGSNLLVSDKGFNGIVIKTQDTIYKIQTDSKIFVGAGLPLAKLVNESVKNNLTGLEMMAGIPGTVGGAIANNAGAFGRCLGDVVESVEILENPPSPLFQRGSTLPPLAKGVRGIFKLNNKECQFSYRNSIFKEEKKSIILNAVLKLEKGHKEESDKKTITPSLKKRVGEILKLRKEKQPLEYPSAGSVFKNPVVDDKRLAELIKEYPEIQNIAKNNIIPAGWLIEQIEGLKGKKIGGAMISEKHCNFIVNFNNAKAEDIIILISLIKQKVRSHFGIQLEEEIEYVGF